MGTPVPTPPIDYGLDCPTCVPPLGTLWDVGKCPMYVYVYFDGLVSCGGLCLAPPNGQTFKLKQVPGTPCLWVTTFGGWTVSWDATVGGGPQSRLELYDQDRRLYFQSFAVKCPEETFIYNNQVPNCFGGNCATGGFAVIHWMGIVMGLVVMMSLPTFSNIMHEIFIKDGTQIVHKFCFPLYGMNIKMLMSP